MKFDTYPKSSIVNNEIYSRKNIFVSLPSHNGLESGVIEFFRFEEKKDKFTWVHEDEICFAQSNDHYIKALIQCGCEYKWMTRHSSITELLHSLTGQNFIRLNRFYLLNLNHCTQFNETKKIIYMHGDFSIQISHRISPFLLRLLKTRCA